MLARRYEFYVRVARTISHLFIVPTYEILFLPLEHTILFTEFLLSIHVLKQIPLMVIEHCFLLQYIFANCFLFGALSTDFRENGTSG